LPYRHTASAESRLCFPFADSTACRLPLAAKITTPFQGESMGYEMADIEVSLSLDYPPKGRRRLVQTQNR
jgi:hypothetical protein